MPDRTRVTVAQLARQGHRPGRLKRPQTNSCNILLVHILHCAFIANMKNGIHHFEPRIAAIYDHLYANSAFKTPKAIATEVQKILRTCIFMEQRSIPGSPAISFTAHENKELLSGAGKAVAEFAK